MPIITRRHQSGRIEYLNHVHAWKDNDAEACIFTDAEAEATYQRLIMRGQPSGTRIEILQRHPSNAAPTPAPPIITFTSHNRTRTITETVQRAELMLSYAALTQIVKKHAEMHLGLLPTDNVTIYLQDTGGGHAPDDDALSVEIERDAI